MKQFLGGLALIVICYIAFNGFNTAAKETNESYYANLEDVCDRLEKINNTLKEIDSNINSIKYDVSSIDSSVSSIESDVSSMQIKLAFM